MYLPADLECITGHFWKHVLCTSNETPVAKLHCGRVCLLEHFIGVTLIWGLAVQFGVLNPRTPNVALDFVASSGHVL